MKKSIGITNDLADIFFIQALREGYSNYLSTGDQGARNAVANYLKDSQKISDKAYKEKFDVLSHLIVMYDNISFPIINQAFSLTEKMENHVEICQVMPIDFYSNRQLEKSELSDDQAMSWKPLLISAVHNINFSENYIEFAKERGRTPIEYISEMFDQFYNRVDSQPNHQMLAELSSAYGMQAEGGSLNYNCVESNVLYTANLIINIMKELIVYNKFNKNNEFDYYSKIFDNFCIPTNTVIDAYGILRTQISNILTLQPAFSSLNEIWSFKSRKKKEIKQLRDEISNLEGIIQTDGREIAIQKAINDIRAANEALIKGTPAKRIAQLATYISAPIGILELLSFGTSFSLIISVVGSIAQGIIDYKCKKSDWLFIAR